MLIVDQLKRNDPQLRLVAIMILACLLVLLGGLWWVQIVKGRYYQGHFEEQSIQTVRVPAMRGKITDRNGEVLAENRPTYSVNLYFEEMRDRFRREYRRIRPVQVVTNEVPFWKQLFVSGTVSTQNVKLNGKQIAALESQARYSVASNAVAEIGALLKMPLSISTTNFQRHYNARLAMPYPVAQRLGPEHIARFEEQSAGRAGVDLETSSTRFYPKGPFASHLLGYLRYDDSSGDGEDSFFWYRLPDYKGVVGVEGYFNEQLRGRAGGKSIVINNLGYRQSEIVWEQPKPGQNIVLTIDARIQAAAEQSLRQRQGANARGAIVVMDVKTGDILAMVSSPAADPNNPHQNSEFWNDPKLRPQTNRATYEHYAPGSIFKTLVGLAILEAGADPNATIYNPGHIYIGRSRDPIDDTVPPGEYNFRRAIVLSSNTYFITNGIRYAGIQNIIKLAQKFHLGEKCGIPTWQEAGGSLPSLKSVGTGWSLGDTANICIGQGKLAVTPLQMTVMTAALANGGKVLWPRLVARIEPQDPLSNEQPVVFPAGRIRDELGVRASSLRIIRDAMVAETEDTEGTGRQAVVTGLRICGKTGTAEVMDASGRKVDKTTWFASFAPYEDPRYAVVVMVESGASGGYTCAPIAHDIYKTILEINRRAPNQTVVSVK
jgi:penicillin-binding protein 2